MNPLACLVFDVNTVARTPIGQLQSDSRLGNPVAQRDQIHIAAGESEVGPSESNEAVDDDLLLTIREIIGREVGIIDAVV